MRARGILLALLVCGCCGRGNLPAGDLGADVSDGGAGGDGGDADAYNDSTG